MHKRRLATGAGRKNAAKAVEDVKSAAESMEGGQAEQEYIVLNRQEEEDSPEAGKRSLADYAELGRYQYFDMAAIRKTMRLTKAVTQKAEALCREDKVSLQDVQSGYAQGRSELVGEAVGEGREGKAVFPVHILFNRDSALYAECQCAECRKHYYSMYYRREYCAYLGALLQRVEEDLRDKNLGDATDWRGMQLIRAFYESHANTVMSDAIGKAESMTLVPRVVLKNGELKVSFKVGEKKLFVVKDLFEFYTNVQESKTASYGSSTSLNHSINNFTEKSRQWIDYIGRITKEETSFEKRMIEANSKDGELALSGWRLDELYGLLGENPLEYEDRDSDTKWKTTLYAKEQNPKISMTIRKNDLGRPREFHGITVSCRMPRLFYGVGTAYYICEAGLCRLDTEFLQKIRIMAQFFNGGALSFQVGRNKLPQFYYSVLPQLEGAVDIMEENAEEIAAFLPPQARFVFYLDGKKITMPTLLTNKIVSTKSGIGAEAVSKADTFVELLLAARAAARSGGKS